MSKNPYPLFSVSKDENPKKIESRIGLLIRLYLINQHPTIAQAIADHFNTILSRLGFIKSIEQRCLYLRLAGQWRCLAWIIKQERLF